MQTTLFVFSEALNSEPPATSDYTLHWTSKKVLPWGEEKEAEIHPNAMTISWNPSKCQQHQTWLSLLPVPLHYESLTSNNTYITLNMRNSTFKIIILEVPGLGQCIGKHLICLRRDAHRVKPSLCPHFHFGVPHIFFFNEPTVLK